MVKMKLTFLLFRLLLTELCEWQLRVLTQRIDYRGNSDVSHTVFTFERRYGWTDYRQTVLFTARCTCTRTSRIHVSAKRCIRVSVLECWPRGYPKIEDARLFRLVLFQGERPPRQLGTVHVPCSFFEHIHSSPRLLFVRQWTHK